MMAQVSEEATQPVLRRPRLPRMFWFAVALLIAGSALVRSINHDESQYVAAIALMRQGLPYRDFAYLQTPLQPLILSPLALVPAGSVLIATRAANAIFGFATVILLSIALRRRASARATMTALAALVCTGAFLLASSLARNDALAMVLLAAALPPLLTATETRSARLFAAGAAALGLAVSTKINAALPAAGAGLFTLIRARQYGPRTLFAFCAGLLVGLLPILIMAAIAPGEFRFYVFDYNLEAPRQWWTSISQEGELDPLRRAIKLVGLAALGSVLVAFIAIPFDRSRTDVRRMLEFMIVGGLIGAFLPVPALVQYLDPLLPPLFVRFGLALDGAQPTHRNLLLVLSTPGSIAGLASASVARFAGLDLVRTAAVGQQVAVIAHGGTVVTLAPEYVAGNGVALDPRFAAGPFLYRTRGQLARRAEEEGRAVSAETLDRALAANPPAVIVVGAETTAFLPNFPRGLDGPLRVWATAHGYRLTSLRSGLVAFVRLR